MHLWNAILTTMLLFLIYFKFFKQQQRYFANTIHDDLNTDKVCNSANPTSVGFVHIYKHCYLVTRDVFYVTFHWESQMEAVFKTCFDAVGESKIDRKIRSELRLMFWP